MGDCKISEGTLCAGSKGIRTHVYRYKRDGSAGTDVDGPGRARAVREAAENERQLVNEVHYGWDPTPVLSTARRSKQRVICGWWYIVQ